MNIPTGLYVNKGNEFIFITSNKKYLYTNLRHSNNLTSKTADTVRTLFKRILPKKFICNGS